MAVNGCSVPCFSVLLVDAQELRHRLEGLGEEEVSVFLFSRLSCPIVQVCVFLDVEYRWDNLQLGEFLLVL